MNNKHHLNKEETRYRSSKHLVHPPFTLPTMYGAKDIMNFEQFRLKNSVSTRNFPSHLKTLHLCKNENSKMANFKLKNTERYLRQNRKRYSFYLPKKVYLPASLCKILLLCKLSTLNKDKNVLGYINHTLLKH